MSSIPNKNLYSDVNYAQLSSLSLCGDVTDFKKVVRADHQLIFTKRLAIAGIVREITIHHLSSSSFINAVKKYYRYGETHKLLKETPYKELLKVGKRKRDLCGVSLKEKIGLYTLYAVRGIPFLLGLYL